MTLQIALYFFCRSHLLDRKRENALIIIVLEHIHEAYMSPLLRHLLRTRVYLRWPRNNPLAEQKFWRTLLKVLRPTSRQETSFSNTVSIPANNDMLTI